MTDLTKLTAVEIAGLVASGETSAVEVTQAHLDRIGAVDDRVHAFLHVDTEGRWRPRVPWTSAAPPVRNWARSPVCRSR